MDAGAWICAVRMGAEGALLATRCESSAHRVHVPASPALVVDATGCGNAFCGALLAALQRGERLVDAASWGSAAAASMAEATGDGPARPLSSLSGWPVQCIRCTWRLTRSRRGQGRKGVNEVSHSAKSRSEYPWDQRDSRLAHKAPWRAGPEQCGGGQGSQGSLTGERRARALAFALCARPRYLQSTAPSLAGVLESQACRSSRSTRCGRKCRSAGRPSGRAAQSYMRARRRTGTPLAECSGASVVVCMHGLSRRASRLVNAPMGPRTNGDVKYGARFESSSRRKPAAACS